MTERRRQMQEDDYQLSMAVSRRAARAEDNDDLRTLLVHRLTDTAKAVARVGLGTGKIAVYCEPCERWDQRAPKDFPQSWTCPRCEREYVMEFAVMEELDDEACHEPAPEA